MTGDQTATPVLGDVVPATYRPRSRRAWIAFAVSTAIAFLYVLLVLLRCGMDGIRWLQNDPAVSIYAAVILPCLIFMLASMFDPSPLRSLRPNLRRALLFILVVGVVAAVCGVALDAGRAGPRPPFSYRDGTVQALADESTARARLPKPREVIASSSDAIKDLVHRERAGYLAGHPPFRSIGDLLARGSAVAVLGLLINLGAALFCLAGFWFALLLLATRRRVHPVVYDRLVFIYLVAITWFPARLYSEWYLNFYSVRDALIDYGTFWLLAGLALTMVVVILLMRRPQKRLVTNLAFVQTALGVLLAGLTGLKPEWLWYAADVLESLSPGFYFPIAGMILAVVLVFSLIVSQEEMPPAAPAVAPDPTTLHRSS
jgi:hypothetical protein